MIYIAAPYSSYKETFKERLFEQSQRALIALDIGLQIGKAHDELVFIPTAYGECLVRGARAANEELPTDAESWKELNDTVIAKCSKMFVIKINGWEDSVGIKHEIKLAKSLDIPVEYMEVTLPDESFYGKNN